MGVKGLLRLLDPIVEKGASVKRFKGKALAIDGYAWLHRGYSTQQQTLCCITQQRLTTNRPTNRCYSCARDSANGMANPRAIAFFMKRIQMLQHYGITPVVVLDGGRPHVKVKIKKELLQPSPRNTHTSDTLSCPCSAGH